MARGQKGKNKSSQAVGKATTRSSQPKPKPQGAGVVPAQQPQEAVVAPAQQSQEEVAAPVPVQQPQEEVAAPAQPESVSVSLTPTWPVWPTSKPGPRSTPPPPGMHSFNHFRPEQFSEVGYNQETGEPGSDSLLRSLPDASMKDQVSFDQQPAAKNALNRRKKRL